MRMDLPTDRTSAAAPLHPIVARSQLVELNVTVEAGRHVLEDVAVLLRQARDDRHPASLDQLPAGRVDAAIAALEDGLRQLDELLAGLDPNRLRLDEALAIARCYIPRQWRHPA